MTSRPILNALKNIRRSPYQALAAIQILIITFFIAELFLLLLWGTQVVSQYFESRPQVMAFFTDEITDTDIKQYQQDLTALPYVQTVTFVDKQDALKFYQNQIQDDPDLLDMITADILPSSLEVSALDIESLSQVKAKLESLPGIEEVIYEESVVEAVKHWSVGIKTGGLIVVGFLAFTSIQTLTIIISMKVAQKRHEIATMRLLGANNWYVTAPFMVEGVIYGLFSSLLSWGLLYLLVLYGTPSLRWYFRDIAVIPVPFPVMLAILIAVSFASVLIAAIAASLSSRRFGR